MTFAKRAGTAAVAAALGIGLSACSSDTSGEATTASDTSTSSPTSQAATSTPAAPSAPQTPAATPGMTLDQYILDNGLTSSAVSKGDPGAPTITLPIPPGWEPAGSRAPQGAYDGIIFTAPPPTPTSTPMPPTIVAFVSKLTGDADPAKVLEYAANETRALPGFEGANEGKPSTLANYQATQIGGFYTKDGVSLLIAQKTVVIPAEDGLFVLKITAEGSEDFAMPLMEATAAIDEQTTITL